MNIHSVEFAGAIGSPGGPAPGTLPQIAFSGRSNVGKSSLINRLLGRTRSHVARVSSTPGKTQEINFYRVVGAGENSARLEFFLVDLPGYGFARVPLEVRGRWRPLIESYLTGTAELRGVVQLIDARHPLGAEDRRMRDFLAATGLPTLFALTKVDKLPHARRMKEVRARLDELQADPDQVVPCSARSGEGTADLLSSLGALLTDSPED